MISLLIITNEGDLFPAKIPERSGAVKMADNEIAKEIMSALTQNQYCEYVQCLSERDTVNFQTFQFTPMGKMFWIDIHRCFTSDGKLNQNHVLELFCEFSGFEPDELRKRVMSIMTSDKDLSLWQHVGRVVTGLNFVSYEAWVEHMKVNSTPCDELLLYVLNRIHCRHTVVFTANRAWSTLKPESNITTDDLLSICDLRLVYLGNKTFGELKRLPMCAPPLPQMLTTPLCKQPQKKVKGRMPVKPLKLSLNSLVKKQKPHPRVSAPGRALFDNSELETNVNPDESTSFSSNFQLAFNPLLDEDSPSSVADCTTKYTQCTVSFLFTKLGKSMYFCSRRTN